MIDSIHELVPATWAVHAPALLVVIPMLMAPIAALMPAGRIGWMISNFGVFCALVMAIVLVVAVRDSELGYISYHMGGWQPPYGIEFRIDALNSMVLLLVSGVGLLASIFGWSSVKSEINNAKISLFYSAYLVCFTGLCGVAATGDAFNLFVFLEISSIATYVLVALGAGRDRRALPAAINYVLMGTIGASFFVVGVGFLYAATGTLNMADLAARLPDLADNTVVMAGYAFIFVGLGIKAAMFPLHQWLPNAYTYSPSFVTMFLAATATKVAIYALIRFLFTVFGIDFTFEGLSLLWVLMPMGLAAMVACSFQAIFQTDVRRMLAYSSVAQVGYILLGVSIGTAAGVSSGLLHLVNHAVIKGALFMAVAGVLLVHSGARLSDFRGLGRRAPLTMTAFAIAGLSLIGVPLTAGFQSKYALVTALLQNGWWWAAVVVVFTSFLAVIYVGRILEAVFFQAPIGPDTEKKRLPVLVGVPLWAMALTSSWIGVDGGFVIGLANDAAASLFTGDAQ
ncbi:MAG: cation:proton antiporter [Hyphomonadaceae bacterium]|nr:cation:proton antiporter [Hyphomonadaceae bacterium]OUX95774.1 MAG: cation:proton antiporter [Hyphomonas sp. TMED17]CAI8332942.1 MAG: Na(+)/H(+) antiporter subunit D [Hyphomonas sp. TMED17]